MAIRGRILGVDYGTKRIGLSISDENQRLAFPKEVLQNDSRTFKSLGEIVNNQDISEIVVGESSDFSGKLNALSARIEVFILELNRRFKLPVHTQKEFLTTVEARKSMNKKIDLSRSQAHSKKRKINDARVDASASALILQRYLDRKNQQNDFN